MARGDFTYFDQYKVDVQNGIHDIDADSIKMAFIDNTAPPTAADAAPHFGGTGTTNHATNELSGGNFPAGGTDIAATIALNAGAGRFDMTDQSFAVNASNPSTLYWAIFYNDTDANKRCIGFLDLGGPVDATGGPVNVNAAATGVSNLDQA